MMRTRHLLLTTLLAATIAASGCGDVGSKPSSNSSTGGGVDLVNSGTNPGGGFGGGGGSYDSGLEDAKLLSETTEAEGQTACDNFSAYLNGTFTEAGVERLFCNIEGIFTAAFTADSEEEAPAICAAQRDQCLMENRSDEIGCPYDDWSNCDVTVAEYEACATAQVQAIAENRDQLTCEAAGLGADPEATFDFENLPECQALTACDGGDTPNDDDVPPPMG